MNLILAKDMGQRQHVGRWLNTLGIEFIELVHVLQDAVEFPSQSLFFNRGETQPGQRGNPAHLFYGNCHIIIYLHEKWGQLQRAFPDFKNRC